MEPIRTLDHVVNQQSFSQQGEGQDTELNTLGYNAYLTVFSINCVHRFPDLTDISNIQYDTVKSLARASFGFSKIALETWNELVPQTQGKKSRLMQRSA